MPTAYATVTTARPSRYLTQLCRHVDQLSRRAGHRHHLRAGGPAHTPPGPDARVTWSETTGTIDLGWGRCTLRAGDGALVLRAEADDPAHLQRLQTQLGARLHRIGRRDQLHVIWQPVTTPAPPPVAGQPHDTAGTGRRGVRPRTVALAAVGVLAVALHLVLGGAAIASASWAGPALDVVLVVVVLKLLASVVLGRRLVHRRRRPAPAEPPAPPAPATAPRPSDTPEQAGA